MGFTLWALFKAALLLVNALAILNESRFLRKGARCAPAPRGGCAAHARARPPRGWLLVVVVCAVRGCVRARGVVGAAVCLSGAAPGRCSWFCVRDVAWCVHAHGAVGWGSAAGEGGSIKNQIVGLLTAVRYTKRERSAAAQRAGATLLTPFGARAQCFLCPRTPSRLCCSCCSGSTPPAVLPAAWGTVPRHFLFNRACLAAGAGGGLMSVASVCNRVHMTTHNKAQCHRGGHTHETRCECPREPAARVGAVPPRLLACGAPRCPAMGFSCTVSAAAYAMSTLAAAAYIASAAIARVLHHCQTRRRRRQRDPRHAKNAKVDLEQHVTGVKQDRALPPYA